MSRLGIVTVLLPLVLGVVMIPARAQEQNPQRKFERRPFDERRFPIAEYAAPEASDEKRRARAKKYDNSDWRIHPDRPSNVTRVDSVDLRIPALPLSESAAVVVGQVTDAKAYLSNDKTGVYSVFTLQLNEILKNSSQVQLSTGSSLEVERDGGRVRFPTGQVLSYLISEYDMPLVGLRYILFLTNRKGQSDFEILTGYELRDGKVFPLDHLPNLYRYADANELSVLRELRSKVP